MIDIVHIHPMLVHFPIVLYLLSLALQLLVMLRRGDLAANDCLATSAFVTLLLAALAASIAAYFGDIALDHAVELGFPTAPLETHATLGITTMSLMLLLAALHSAARWKKFALTSTRGWGVLAVTLFGALLLIVTAYHGGNLVYQLGVNVHGVTP